MEIEMSFDYKKARVDCHNDFPTRVLFRTEEKFKALIDKNHGAAPFTPIRMAYNDDVTFQTCIGHLGDGLEFLPFRPDYMFDHCFKVIDEAGKRQFSTQGGLKGIVQGVGNKLLSLPNNRWGDIIELLACNTPVLTSYYITKRIFESEAQRIVNDKDNKSRLAKRARACFHAGQYEEFIKKFACDSNGVFSISVALDRDNLQRAAKFLIMILKGQKGTKTKNPDFPLLDLSNDGNHFPPNKKCEFITSVILYNARNERAHGSTLSPFRTSKSEISRYEGYYFSMLCAYIISLGIFELNGYGGYTSNEVYSCCEINIKAMNNFF